MRSTLPVFANNRKSLPLLKFLKGLNYLTNVRNFLKIIYSRIIIKISLFYFQTYTELVKRYVDS